MLTVVGDRDQGCPGGPSDRCKREIDIESATGLSRQQAAQIVVSALTLLRGWRLGPFPSACRNEGWLLGREDICAKVRTGQKSVRVLLEVGM